MNSNGSTTDWAKASRRKGVGHACCECVPRLLAQNHASAALADQRAKGWQSELTKLKALMDEATKLNRGWLGLSAYGAAALATALMEADAAAARLRQRGLAPRSTTGAAALERRLRRVDPSAAPWIAAGAPPPDPLVSPQLGIHVQPLLPQIPADGTLAAFVWTLNEWTITGEVGVADDVLAVRRLTIERTVLTRPDGTPSSLTSPPNLTSSLLRQIKLDAALRDISSALAVAADAYLPWAKWLHDHDLDPASAIQGRDLAKRAAASVAVSSRRRGRSGKGEDHYRNVAILYLRACQVADGNAVYEHIAKQLPEGDRSRETIRYWVRRAYELGYLGKAHPGRAGRSPGPKLIEEKPT